jgi:hypothetical protein
LRQKLACCSLISGLFFCEKIPVKRVWTAVAVIFLCASMACADSSGKTGVAQEPGDIAVELQTLRSLATDGNAGTELYLGVLHDVDCQRHNFKD